MLLTKELEVIPHGKAVRHYRERGYDAKTGVPLIVKVEDLLEGSHEIIETLCDYCKEEIVKKPYKVYLQSIKTVNKTACDNCLPLKREECTLVKYGVKSIARLESVKEKRKNTLLEKYGVENAIQIDGAMDKRDATNLEKYGTTYPGGLPEFLAKKEETCLLKYGVKNPFESEEIKEKSKTTLLERYGVDNPLKLPLIIDKIRETSLERYGVDWSSKSPEVQQKIKDTCIERYGTDKPITLPEIQDKVKQTCLKRYGTESPLQNDDIKVKIMDTCMKKYGFKNPSQAPEVREKIAKTFYENSSQKCSTQQLYLYNLYNTNTDIIALNYPIARFSIDICFLEEKICLEYDGGFHNGQVKLGQLTQEEFNQKEIVRNNIIKREGYKLMRVISSHDYLPSDEKLLEMLEHTRQYFSENPERSWIEFNIDTSTVHNALQKEGSFFDYGELRKIKKTA